jgi:hypothetical protein
MRVLLEWEICEDSCQMAILLLSKILRNVTSGELTMRVPNSFSILNNPFEAGTLLKLMMRRPSDREPG